MQHIFPIYFFSIVFICNWSTGFFPILVNLPKILQCIKVSNRYPQIFERERNARRVHIFQEFSCRSLKWRKRWSKGEQDTKGGRVQEMRKRTKKEKDTKCTDVSSRHRVAWPSTCTEWWALHDSRRRNGEKEEKKETFYGHGGSCCCLFAVGQCRRGDRGIEENHQFVDRN